MNDKKENINTTPMPINGAVSKNLEYWGGGDVSVLMFENEPKLAEEYKQVMTNIKEIKLYFDEYEENYGLKTYHIKWMIETVEKYEKKLKDSIIKNSYNKAIQQNGKALEKMDD